MARAPGFEKYPDHRVDAKPAAGRVQASAGGTAIADTQAATRVEEDRHDPVYYFPRADVRMELLVRSEHSTYCPFKGQASYYSIALPDGTLENCVWSYEDPYDESADLRDLLAFYADRVEIRD